MSQIALPLAPAKGAPSRIIVGAANAEAVEALCEPERWPFRTAVLAGPARSGKSLLARWFVESGAGDVLDDAHTLPEEAVFHGWNRAQESGRPLLLVVSEREWRIKLPDLSSRVGAALHMGIGAPDEAMLAQLIAVHGEMRGLVLDEAAAAYLVPRCERSHVDVERLVAAIDRLSLERKQPPTMAIWRDALNEVKGAGSSHAA